MFLKRAGELEDYAIGIRRNIHENPEISGKEEKTVKYVKDKLEEAHINYVEVPNGGILGFIKGKMDGNKTLLLRADLDALPIDEPEFNLSQKREVISKNKGAMHACGHDAHTAILITSGIILNENREKFGGTVILCFERGEEYTQNYRYIMAYLDFNNINIDSSFAIHVSPQYDAGVIAIKGGNMNAAPIIFDVEIVGEGGHGARPYLINSPLDTFVTIYNNLMAMRVNNYDPFEPLTYSIGEVSMGNTFNQIPDTLRFKGSVRFFDREKVGYKFYEEFKKLIEDACLLHNTKPIYHNYTKPHFSIINDEKLADFATEIITDELGKDHVIEAKASMGSDTFSVYIARWPGIYINLGITNIDKGMGASLHNPAFDLEEGSLKYAISATVRYTIEYLNSNINVSDTKYKNEFKKILREEEIPDEKIKKIYEIANS